jgi:predicted PhzF superfamily epimerase YddE/YHI9
MRPDQKLLLELPGRIQNATALGDKTGADCVSRSFCPKLSIPEDPVCGSAHCQIAPFWAEVLGKETIRAFQASGRGGSLECTLLDGGRIAIRGQAVPVAVCDLLAEL